MVKSTNDALRDRITAAGGSPTQNSSRELLRELVELSGEQSTQMSFNGILREAVTIFGGTPTKYSTIELLREWNEITGGDTSKNSINELIEAIDLFPPEPVPPGPFDREISLIDSGTPYTTAYNSPTGIMIVRFDGLNGDASVPAPVVTWNGTPLVMAQVVADSVSGHPVCWLAGIHNGFVGTADIVVSMTSGVLETGLLRIGDLSALDADWVGAIVTQFANTSTLSLPVTPELPGDGQLSVQAAWADDRSFPISVTSPIATQYTANTFELGADVVINGTFDADTNWTKGTAWSIAAGVATRGTHATISTQLRQLVALTPGDRYLSTYDITATTGGTARFIWALVTGHSPVGEPQTDVGTYVQAVTVPTGTGSVAQAGYGLKGETDVVSMSFDNFKLEPIVAGSSGFFGNADTPDSALSVVITSSFTAWAAGLVVELKGAALP